MSNKFGYYINLDERGAFLADVRSAEGKTVFEIRAGNELGEDETSIFDDGFMRHKDDLRGLQDYLVQLGVLQPGDEILPMREFELWQEKQANSGSYDPGDYDFPAGRTRLFLQLNFDPEGYVQVDVDAKFASELERLRKAVDGIGSGSILRVPITGSGWESEWCPTGPAGGESADTNERWLTIDRDYFWIEAHSQEGSKVRIFSTNSVSIADYLRTFNADAPDYMVLGDEARDLAQHLADSGVIPDTAPVSVKP